jgi:5-methylcytosine-specific restriction enzyme subunit McrC
LERTVYPCREYDVVEVPLDVISKGGRIDVYPDLSNFFDIDYRSGRIVLAAKSFVGLIPVNDRVAIHVLPRFPISNLFYILQRAEARLRFASGHIRGYDLASGSGADPAALLGGKLLEMLTHVRREGLLRRYESRVRDDEIGGELLLSETVSRFYSQGVRHRQVRKVTALSADIIENQVIKSAINKLANFYSNLPDKESARSARTATEALAILFDQVPFYEGHPHTLRHHLPHYIDRLPAVHKPYAILLWLSYLIESRQGLTVEKMGPIAFDTFVVNLAEVFEDYARQLIREKIDQLLPGAKVKNGNTDQVPLFAQGLPLKVKPDIYLVHAGKAVVVLDAKYKPQIKPADRYEVLAFCEALQVKTAIVLSPSVGGPDIELIGRTHGGVELHVVRIDLGAGDMQKEEGEFTSRLKAVMTAVA